MNDMRRSVKSVNYSWVRSAGGIVIDRCIEWLDESRICVDICVSLCSCILHSGSLRSRKQKMQLKNRMKGEWERMAKETNKRTLVEQRICHYYD